MNAIKKLIISVALSLCFMPLMAQQWFPDTLGTDFQVRYFDQGKDYSGAVRSSLVRLRDSIPAQNAVLYIHGFNDYFFQSEMAYRFRAHGYDFYAVDLRKYGRSLLPGQKRCQVRSFNEYIPDIDSALMVIGECGYDKVVMMGHSTGGLVATYYLDKKQNADIDALILNSPFLDWNLGNLECFINLVSATGALMPGVTVKSGSGTAYGESLLADYHGEWQFNTDWKSIEPTMVDLGWIRAVNSAQHYVRKHKYEIKMPILLMYSANSINAEDWSPSVNKADAVLDVKDIRKYGMMLGHDVTAISVNGGMHDLILSSKDVREPLYTYIFNWLQEALHE